jgi:hypothetical protein
MDVYLNLRVKPTQRWEFEVNGRIVTMDTDKSYPAEPASQTFDGRPAPGSALVACQFDGSPGEYPDGRRATGFEVILVRGEYAEVKSG